MAKLRLPDWRDAKVRARLIIWLLTALIVVVAFAVSAVAFTSTKTFCGWCHEMEAPMTANADSSHGPMSCYACHMPNGATPILFMAHKVSALKELYLHFTNSYEKPLNAEHKVGYGVGFNGISMQTCNQCHAVLKRNVTPGPGIIINHKAHMDKKIGCTLCHNRVAHPNMPVYADADWMKMEACFRCHTQEAEGVAAAGAEATKVPSLLEEERKIAEEMGYKFSVTGKCDACHPKGFELKPGNHLAQGWMPKGHHQAFSTLEEAALKAEAGGEGEGGGEAEAEPATGAAAAALEAAGKPCESCHAVKFCNDCHGITMPHPSSFKQEHKKYAAQKTEICGRCHGGVGFCNKCHHNDVPTIKAWLAPPGHPDEVKKNGAEQCFKCHDPRLCETCHIRGKSDRKYL